MGRKGRSWQGAGVGRAQRGLPTVRLGILHSQALGNWPCPELESSGAQRARGPGSAGQGRVQGPLLY